MNILLGITGSVAATLTEKIYNNLAGCGDVRVVATKDALNFYDCPDYTDECEWEMWSAEKKVLHIELRRWADILIIAPLSMNTLAKLANGICDNLLTCIWRAWDYRKPIIVAPAANTHMWLSSITERHIETIKSDTSRLAILEPVWKELACGDSGIGAMADIETICECVNEAFIWAYPLSHHPRFIPANDHPGAFGVKRKHDRHTGVDLYANNTEDYIWNPNKVNAVEPGTVVSIEDFTGQKAGSPWWLDSKAVLIEGPAGVVNYGEIDPCVKIGDEVNKNTTIGHVVPVLPREKVRSDIPHHNNKMLHIELYTHGTRKSVTWGLDEDQPSNLLNPTSRLYQADRYLSNKIHRREKTFFD